MLIAFDGTAKWQRQLPGSKISCIHASHPWRGIISINNKETTCRCEGKLVCDSRGNLIWTFALSQLSFVVAQLPRAMHGKLKMKILTFTCAQFASKVSWWRGVRRQLHVSLEGLTAEIWGEHSPHFTLIRIAFETSGSRARLRRC